MDADGNLARLAGRRYGLFTLTDARQAGVSSNMLTARVKAGLIERREPAVYGFVGAPTTWHQGVLVACLAEQALASHRTAAALWAFDGCRPGVVEVVTERWRRRPNRSIRVHETRLLPEEDRAEVDGIPATSRARTLVDLGAVVPRERVEQALDGALNRKEVTPEAVWECVERLDVPGRPWVAVTRRLLASRLGLDQVLPNAFERKLFGLLEAAGVALPNGQVEIRRPDGTLIGRVDWLYPRQRIVIECDSEEWHGGWRRRKRDHRRDRQLAALGYTVLRISWEDLVDFPDQVVADIVGALDPIVA